MSVLPDPAAGPMPRADAEAAFAAILDQEVDADAITAFLVALADRGETPTEIAAAVTAMRARMRPIAGPSGAIDVCGTGGDGSHSLNVSTAVAIVVAACGVPVAKHGNRAASSRAGAADTLEALGLDLSRAAERAAADLADPGLAFLFAPLHHPALGPLAPIRRSIGRRTIFNLLGPLANPARVQRQIIGVPHPDMIDRYAAAVAQLGFERVLILSGDEGLDELSIAGPSQLAWVEGAAVRRAAVTPKDAGLPRHSADRLRGGDAAFNAAALSALLDGAPGAYRDAVLFNAAAALMVAGEVDDWRAGVEEAAEAIDKGLARAMLDCWIAANRTVEARA